MEDDFKLYSITIYYIYQECLKRCGLIKDGYFKKKEWPKKLVLTLSDYIKNDFLASKPENEKKAYIDAKFGTIDRTTERYTGYEGYLRDRFNWVVTSLNENKKGEIKEFNFDKEKFDPLLRYAKIDDYETINNSFKYLDEASKFLIENVLFTEKKKEFYLLDIEIIPPKWVLPNPAKKNFAKNIATNNEVNDDKNVNIIDKNKLNKERENAIVYPLKIPVVSILKPVKWYNLLPIPDEGELIFDEDGNCEYKGGYSLSIKRDIIKGDAITCANPRDPEACWVKVNYSAGESSKTAYFAEPLAGPNSLKLTKPERLLALFNKKASD